MNESTTITIDNMLDAIGHGTTYTSEELQKIIKALPPVNPQPCGDAVSRQAVLDCFTATKLKKFDFILYARKEIKKLPPVNPQPKTGHWTHDGSHWKNRFICSECNYKLFDEPTNYCPNCGCAMVEPE